MHALSFEWRCTVQLIKEVMAALLNGSLDAVMGSGVLEAGDLKTLQTKYVSDFHVFLGPPIMNRIIIMNANKAPTDDLTLRKVIMHAVNKAAIIDKELYGLAEPVDTMFPKNAPYCNLDLTPRWDYDFEKAKLLNCPSGMGSLPTGFQPLESTATPTAIPTKPPTNPPVSAAPVSAAPVSAGQMIKKVISGSLAMTVPNADEFIADTAALNAVKEGIADSLQVSMAYIEVSAAKATSRRLQERLLSGSDVVITYTVTIPPEESASVKETVAATANAVTVDTLSAAIQSKVTSAKGSDYTVAVTAKATPTITDTAITTTVAKTTPVATTVAVSQGSSSTDDDDDGISAGVIVAIVVGGLVIAVGVAIVFYVWGKKQGILQEQLLQQQKAKNRSNQIEQQDDVVGKPAGSEKADATV